MTFRHRKIGCVTLILLNFRNNCLCPNFLLCRDLSVGNFCIFREVKLVPVLEILVLLWSSTCLTKKSPIISWLEYFMDLVTDVEKKQQYLLQDCMLELSSRKFMILLSKPRKASWKKKFKFLFNWIFFISELELCHKLKDCFCELKDKKCWKIPIVMSEASYFFYQFYQFFLFY